MIVHCKTCLMPSTRPRIVFKDGICNACHWAEEKKGIDWDRRADEFEELVNRKQASGYDCVVPFSGGKDSAAIAHKLKFDFGLNPLLVTYGQMLWTDAGRRNFERVCEAGFDIFYWRVNQAVSRKLARRFFIERGHPKQHYDAGVNAVPVITAKQFNIPLIFYAEHGETEYGGHVLSDEHRRTRDLTEVLEHQVGDHPSNWATDGISDHDLYPYIYPSMGDGGPVAYYFSYFFPWDIYENAQYVQGKMNWRLAHGGRSMGSFEGFDSMDDMIDDLDFYMMYIKFGFGRATRMASRMIQNGHMTRDRGLELVRQYDGEFPERYYPEILHYLDMGPREFEETIDMHRNPEIWEKEGTKWRLKHLPA